MIKISSSLTPASCSIVHHPQAYQNINDHTHKKVKLVKTHNVRHFTFFLAIHLNCFRCKKDIQPDDCPSGTFYEASLFWNLTVDHVTKH